VLANRLSADSARRVLLLEAGRAAPLASSIPANWGTMLNTSVDWSFHTEPQEGCKGRRLYWPRGKMVGGSGAMNAMIYIRGLPSDYNRWADEGATGWAWADVFPVFLRSEDNARFGNSPFHRVGGPLTISDAPYVDPTERLVLEAAKAAGLPANDDLNGAQQEGVGFYQLTVRHGERFGTGKAFLSPAQGRPNLTLRTGVLATRVVLEHGRAVGVEFLENGRLQTAHASSEVVLSSGSIGSAQLLLLSGIGPVDELRAAGVAPLHDLPSVGKNLQDHIQIYLTFATTRPVGFDGMTADQQAAAFAEWETHRTGPFTSNWAAVGGFARSRPGVAEPDLQLYGEPTADRDHGRYLAATPGISLTAVLQRPDSRGVLRLRSADPLEHPAIDPRYFVSDADGSDLATLADGVKLCRRIAAQSPLRELVAHEMTPSAEAQTDGAIANFIRGHCATLYHPTSTCRIGTDALAVVDPQLRVRGIQGLRVADASVFPRIVSGNTNAPTIMVAERAAEFILSGA
jgi:choline dehydrogenase